LIHDVKKLAQKSRQILFPLKKKGRGVVAEPFFFLLPEHFGC
jgi:hypothetical protein